VVGVKTLEKGEFIDRTMALLRAQRIFVDSGVTNNISVAFEIYQEMLATQERAIKLSANEHTPINQKVESIEEKCPVCGKNLVLLPPCCNSKFGTKECLSCGWKVMLTL
jgi:predicted RNA-binding Zn-ribbon protein involved in translation (DUF1610 family)